MASHREDRYDSNVEQIDMDEGFIRLRLKHHTDEVHLEQMQTRSDRAYDQWQATKARLAQHYETADNVKVMPLEAVTFQDRHRLAEAEAPEKKLKEKIQKAYSEYLIKYAALEEAFDREYQSRRALQGLLAQARRPPDDNGVKSTRKVRFELDVTVIG